MSEHHPDRLLRQAVGNAEQAFLAATSAGEMLGAAGWTIFMRLALMAGGVARGRVDDREMRRMVFEKVEAASECATHAVAGWGEMQTHLLEAWADQMQAGWEFAQAAAGAGTGAPAELHKRLNGDAMSAALTASLALGAMLTRSYARSLQPYHRRTSANAKRLSRRRGW